eukprot:TRINITY_DN44584_c0_g1_i3.p1 TRINITY_DN44584_c0_g1~~TRINITY_DN44584_c0_g1_i3.p1  ORF type:complete len:177 (-),score=25.02 TRINITY_DN44584_c0_g1_i3:12-476(-)
MTQLPISLVHEDIKRDLEKNSMIIPEYDEYENPDPLQTASISVSTYNSRGAILLQKIPFVVPFDDRVKIFYQLIEYDKMELKKRGAMDFERGMGIRASIRRKRVLTDGFRELGNLGARLKQRVQISFVDEHGVREIGRAVQQECRDRSRMPSSA